MFAFSIASQRSAHGRYSASDALKVTVDCRSLDKKPIYLTDARLVGVMLRDGRLTLRSHSALTELVIESVSDKDIVLHATAAGDQAYVRTGDKGAFFANASREQALKFQMQVTDIGMELCLGEKRPAVFDDNNDVSIGEWKTGRSSIPILVHMDSSKIWKSPALKEESTPLDQGAQF